MLWVLFSLPIVLVFVWCAACILVAALTWLIETFMRLFDWLIQPDEPAHIYTLHDIPIHQYPEWRWDIEYQTLTPDDFRHHQPTINWQREGF